MNEIADRLAAVRQAIATAAARGGRRAEEIELVAVSKTHPPETLLAALAAGQSVFGENRVQEARAKIPLLPGRVRWHLIGPLQKNKIRHALAAGFDLFHSIDTLELAREFDRIAAETGQFPRVLLEVNVAGEASKFGFSSDKLCAEMEELLKLGRLHIEGLMTIPPFAPEAEKSRPFFLALRALRDRLQTEFRVPLPRLSMGMSGDFAVAVEEGATLVRVGTAIFGTRRGKAWKPQGNSVSLDD